MFNELDEYLANVVTPELRATMVSTCELMAEMGVEGHSFAIDQELSMADNADTAITVQSIHSIIIETLRALLDQMGVETRNNMPLYKLADMMRALNALTNYEDQVSVATLIDEASDNIDAFGAVLELVGQFTAHDYIELVVSVSDDLLTRLRSLNSDQEAYDKLPDPAVVQLARERFKRCIKLHPKTLIETKVREGARIGIPADDLIDEVGDPIHDLDAAKFGVEMGAIHLASDLPNEALADAAKAMIQKFSSDLPFVARANVEAVTVITEALS